MKGKEFIGVLAAYKILDKYNTRCSPKVKAMLLRMKKEKKESILATPNEMGKAGLITGPQSSTNKQLLIWGVMNQFYFSSHKPFYRIVFYPVRGWEGDQYLSKHSGLKLINVPSTIA